MEKRMKRTLGVAAAFSAAVLASCIGMMIPSTAQAAEETHGEHADWTKVESAGTLTGGNCYLDKQIGGELVIQGEVTLCLNGQELEGSGNGSVITVSEGASLTLCDCRKNESNNVGGTVYQTGVITGGNAEKGGGICVETGASLTMTGGAIAKNKASKGGGIFSEGTVTLSGDCIVESNTAQNSESNTAQNSESNTAQNSGGGVYLSAGSLTVNGNASIAKNQASTGGGIWSAGTVTLSGDCIVESNTAQDGGGVFLSGGSLTVDGNASIAKNEASYGGGLFASTGTVVTISDGNFGINSIYGNEQSEIEITGGSFEKELNEEYLSPDHIAVKDPDNGYVVCTRGGAVTFTPGQTSTFTYDGSEVEFTATASNNAAVSYRFSDAEDGEYTDGLPVGAGEWYVKAVSAALIEETEEGKVYYPETDSEAFKVTVEKADPVYTAPSGLKVCVGGTLSDIELPMGWAWKDSTTSVGDEEAPASFPATFTPEDRKNYNTVETEIAVAVLQHNEVKVPAVPATCTEDGLTEGSKCSLCGKVFVEQTVVPATGHTPGPEATCTQDQVCKVCGEVLVEKKGHTAGEAVRENVKPATCTEAGSYEEVILCTVCGEELSRTLVTVEATGHMPETVAGRQPTCTEAGLTDGVKCSACGTLLEEQTALPALGHTFGEWTVSSEAGVLKEGEEVRTCQRCGVTETRAIAAEPFPVWGIVLICVGGAAVITGVSVTIVLLRKKKAAPSE